VKHFQWGPLERLHAQLARGAPGLTRRRRLIRALPSEFGYLGDLIHPGLARRIQPPPGRRSIIDRLLVLTAASLPAPRKPPPGIAQTLADCHQHIGRMVVESLVPLYAPFWADLPVQLAGISEKAVAWALLLHAMETAGPRAVIRSGIIGAYSSFGYKLAATDPPGDFLALHLLAGRAAAIAYPQAPSSHAQAGHAPSPLKAGGLRSAASLESYRWIGRRRGAHAGWWAEAARVLVEASPLTRLAYADLLCMPVEAAVIPPMLHMGSQCEPWHELWLSHLARTLTAVMLSPAPAYEEWRAAATLADRLEKQVQSGGASPLLRVQLAEAVRRRTILQSAMNNHYCQRLEILAGTLLASRALHLRVADMFTRNIVARSTPRIRRAYAEAADSEERRALRLNLFSASGICFNELWCKLLGDDWKTVIQQLSSTQHAHLQALFDLKLGSDGDDAKVADRIRREQGVSIDYANRLCLRLREFISLPFPQPHHRTLPVSSAVGESLAELINMTAAVAQVSVEEV